MAPWEEFVVAFNLKHDTPQNVIDWLIFLTDTEDIIDTPDEVPDHYFFEFEDWVQVFWDETYCFPGTSISRFVKDERTGQYSLTARTMVRGGDYLVAALMSWLAQYSETEGFIGYTRCDEIHNLINHIHFRDGEAYYHVIDFLHDPLHVKKVKLSQEKGPYGDEIMDE